MADIFGNLASGLGSLFGASESTQSTLSGLGDLLGGAYSLYQGFNQESQYNDYLNALYASQEVSDEILKEQAARAKELYYPIEDLQAQYALEDLQSTRDLSLAQQQYNIDKGYNDIALAQDVVDPLTTSLLTQLSQGADAQKYMDIASTDVSQAFDQSLNETQRAYNRLGINPNSGTLRSAIKQFGLSEAAAKAGARTQASRTAEDLDLSRKQQALNYASGVPFTTQEVSQSGSTLASQAAAGFQSAASGLTSAAKLASASADDNFAGASAAFKNMSDYFKS